MRDGRIILVVDADQQNAGSFVRRKGLGLLLSVVFVEAVLHVLVRGLLYVYMLRKTFIIN